MHIVANMHLADLKTFLFLQFNHSKIRKSLACYWLKNLLKCKDKKNPK